MGVSMQPRPDPIATNRLHWESRVALHAASAEYGLDAYRSDPNHLSDVVLFDRDRLGDIAGRDVVHLQCHIGTDTLSLARLGARVTGLDFSPSAIEVARSLSEIARPHVDYVVATVDDAVSALGGRQFDLVYTGIGALCWLPKITSWATTVAALLRPEGELFIREAHPVVWALDDPRSDGLVALEYPYFETDGVVAEAQVTYVDHEDALASPRLVHFNHGLGEIFAALTAAGLTMIDYVEHDTIPWRPLGDAMVDVGGGEFRLMDRPERLPMSYTLRAVRNGSRD